MSLPWRPGCLAQHSPTGHDQERSRRTGGSEDRWPRDPALDAQSASGAQVVQQRVDDRAGQAGEHTGDGRGGDPGAAFALDAAAALDTRFPTGPRRRDSCPRTIRIPTPTPTKYRNLLSLIDNTPRRGFLIPGQPRPQFHFGSVGIRMSVPRVPVCSPCSKHGRVPWRQINPQARLFHDVPRARSLLADEALLH